MHINFQIISYYSKDIFPCHLILRRSDKLIRLYLISTFRCFVVLVLLFVALFFSTRRFVLCLTLCLFFVLVVFSPFSIVITSLGEKRAYPDAFCTFVRFVLVWICQLPLPLGVWEGLRFVIVALPGLFSYQFFFFFLLFKAICFFKTCLVLFCSCNFQSFQHCDYLTWARDS